MCLYTRVYVFYVVVFCCTMLLWNELTKTHWEDCFLFHLYSTSFLSASSRLTIFMHSRRLSFSQSPSASVFPCQEAGVFLVRVLPPVWNFGAFSLIPLFYGPLLCFCLVLLLFLSSFFCYWSIHLPFIFLNLVFSKDRLFRPALVLLFLSG